MGLPVSLSPGWKIVRPRMDLGVDMWILSWPDPCSVGFTRNIVGSSHEPPTLKQRAYAKNIAVPSF